MKNIRFILFTVMVAAFAFECKKDSGPSDPGSGGPLTEQEKQAIIQTYQNIEASADSLLKTDNPITGFQSMLTTYRSAANVENAWVTSDGLYIKFKKGGIVSWLVPPDAAAPPYDRPDHASPMNIRPLLRESSQRSANTVLLINQLNSDEGRFAYRDYLASTKRRFEAHGYTVTTLNDAQANVALFRSGLKQFGAIYLITHGEYQADSMITWLLTGEAGTIQGLVQSYTSDWDANRISLGTSTEIRGGQKTTIDYYKISNRLIQSSYAVGDFPGTVLYFGACEALKNRNLAQAFVDKGAAAVVGWDALNSVGPSTGRLVFSYLLCGKSLQDAIRALPREAKFDYYKGGRLIFHPNAAETFRLVTSERRSSLNIVRPKKDSTYTARNLQFEGNLIAGDSISSGIVELNAVSTALALASDRRTFSQPLVVKSGSNTMHTTGLVTLSDGKCSCIDTSYNFQGNFSPLDLWTELRWNTDLSDVDFHLLPPGASFPGDFWTASDCYYSNRSTSWGGFLDVDDVNGRGPEHITIPTVTTQGTYRLFVHYYASHGAGPTSAYVSVSVRNGPNEEFGPMALSRSASRGGDIWEVCTITYPAGTITRVMTKTTLSGSDNGASTVQAKKR